MYVIFTTIKKASYLSKVIYLIQSLISRYIFPFSILHNKNVYIVNIQIFIDIYAMVSLNSPKFFL